MFFHRQVHASSVPQATWFGRNPRRSRTAALFDWALGTNPEVNEPDRASSVERESSRIVVAAPGNESRSWIDSFYAAVTEAATDFIYRHVEPLHREDPSAGYGVYRLKVGLKDAAAPCIQAIQSIPQVIRDRIALLRMNKARGSEMLVLNSFYGVSFVADETLVDGQLVETLVSYSGARFQLRFEFEGEYITLPESRLPETSEEGRRTVDMENSRSAIGPVQTLGDKNQPNDCAFQRTREGDDLSEHSTRRDTPINVPSHSAGLTKCRDTPLNHSIRTLRRPVARMHLATVGGGTMVELYEDGFPYTVGRHPESPGFAVRPCNANLSGLDDVPLLAQKQPSDTICFVSRDHLRLHKPDITSGEVRVDNLSAQREKNGTYVNGQEKGVRFMHSLNGPTMRLGGSGTDGTLDVRLEGV